MLITFLGFMRFPKFLRHFKDIAEHYISDEKLFSKWRRKWKNEDENFQLLYYLFCMGKSCIGGFLIPWTLQICKWFPLKIFIFEQPLTFIRMTCRKVVKNRLKHALFLQSMRRKVNGCSKIINLRWNHLHIYNVQGMRNPPIQSK